MASPVELTRALDLAASGDWSAAHELVQQYPNDQAACWLHACLHRVEGDAVNAAYWYRRAGQRRNAFEDTAAELQAIRAALEKSV